MTPLLRNALKNFLKALGPEQDRSGRRVTPIGVCTLAILPAISWVIEEATLPYVLGAEALWAGVWAFAGAGAAWGIFKWGLVAVVVTAVYWFLSNLS